ncbi:unnamed protein product [Dicrocoelium dendriticum]|nr:unnamed protein product [Dicrocoelium dendriticum]
MEQASLIKVNNLIGSRLCGPKLAIFPEKLALTKHHLLFVTGKKDFKISYKSIDAIRFVDSVSERRYPISGQTGFTLLLYTKSFYIYELTVCTLDEARALQQSIESLISNCDVTLLYPFFYEPPFSRSVPKFILDEGHLELLKSPQTNGWRVSSVNRSYEVCPSYPKKLLVPADISDSVITESGNFRRGGRFPILVYYHRPRDTALLIASEPLITQSSANVGQSLLPSGTIGITGGSVRLPGISYLTSSSNLSTTSTGVTPANRCKADEQLLAAVLAGRHRGIVLDLRDQAALKRSSLQVGVTDSETHYSQWRRVSRPMEPPGSLNEIFSKFIKVCTASGRTSRSTSTSFGNPNSGALVDSLNAIASVAIRPTNSVSTVDHANIEVPRALLNGEGESTSVMGGTAEASQLAIKIRPVAAWLTTVREALAAAVAGATALDARDAFAQQQLQQAQCLLAQKYKDSRSSLSGASRSEPMKEEAKLQGSFVLVQSSQGCDRALVVASLIQIILDPYSRTYEGFQILIERYWIQAGHPFTDRCSHSAFSPLTSGSHSPTFLLFLDCIWQLWQQYPNCFQFTDELLCALSQHVYDSEFGTFLGNNMKERDELNIESSTTSI